MPTSMMTTQLQWNCSETLGMNYTFNIKHNVFDVYLTLPYVNYSVITVYLLHLLIIIIN